MIQSVTALIPTQAMQTIQLPKGLLEELESLNRKFFWADEDQKRRLHTVAWSTICRNKSEGGLGIKDLEHMNMTLLAKLAWQMISNPESLWAKVL